VLSPSPIEKIIQPSEKRVGRERWGSLQVWKYKDAGLLCVPWWYGNKKEVKATLGNHLSL
jgi:hypothetical protein